MLCSFAAMTLFAAPAAAQTQQSGTIVSTAPPDYYVVQQGDTLWEISSSFLGNPYYWPQLWSINEQVTNPHWIYPGNRIVFREGTVLDPPELELGGSRSGVASRDGYSVQGYDYGRVAATCGPNTRFEASVPTDRYESLVYIAKPEDVAVFGQIHKARARRMTLSENDLLYLKMDDPDAWECGDMVQVFRSDPIYKNRYYRAPKLKDGDLYRIIANLQIIHRAGDIHTAVVRTSFAHIERGNSPLSGNDPFLVGPVLPTNVELEVAKPRGDIEGEIVSLSTAEKDTLTVADTVFIDRGRADGVRVGQSFYVYERVDELERDIEDDELPQTVVGRLVVVRVDDYVSSAVVTDASRNLRLGHRIAQSLE